MVKRTRERSSDDEEEDDEGDGTYAPSDADEDEEDADDAETNSEEDGDEDEEDYTRSPDARQLLGHRNLTIQAFLVYWHNVRSKGGLQFPAEVLECFGTIMGALAGEEENSAKEEEEEGSLRYAFIDESDEIKELAISGFISWDAGKTDGPKDQLLKTHLTLEVDMWVSELLRQSDIGSKDLTRDQWKELEQTFSEFTGTDYALSLAELYPAVKTKRLKTDRDAQHLDDVRPLAVSKKLATCLTNTAAFVDE